MTRMLLLLPLLLTGCASLPPSQADGPRTGDTLVQHREITVPAGREIYWIQDGQLGLTSLFAWRNPYCELQFAGTDSGPRLLPPRRYEVSAVHYRTLIGASLPYMVAGPLLAGETGDNAEQALFEITLELGSSRGGGLESMVCAQRADLRDGRYPSREQLNETLSPHLSLVPAGAP